MQNQQEKPPKNQPREIWILLTLAGIQFTHILDFMIMMPLGPQLQSIFNIRDADFGFLVSSYSFAAGASGLFAAFYMDRFDRKKLLLILYSLFALATLACGLAQSYSSLMFARIAAGLFGGVLTALSQTIVADLIPAERRGKAMGIVMSSFSISTVAGVPLGLFLATHFSWHWPFISIALMSFALIFFASQSLPPLNQHLLQHLNLKHSENQSLQAQHQSSYRSAIANFIDTLKNPDHQKTLLFTLMMMFVGFSIIPYITLYLTSNSLLRIDQIPYIYLCGGIATLISARLIGRATDKYGKLKTFRLLAILTTLPIFALTVSAQLPVWLIFTISTFFFIFVSGRMIPGMAIVTSACNPRQRGTFMALNSAVQSLGMSSAAFIGGLIISRDSLGMINHYWGNGLLGVAASLLAFWLAGKLRLKWD